MLQNVYVAFPHFSIPNLGWRLCINLFSLHDLTIFYKYKLTMLSESVTTRSLMIPVSTVCLLLSCIAQYERRGKKWSDFRASGKNQFSLWFHCNQSRNISLTLQLTNSSYQCAHKQTWQTRTLIPPVSQTCSLQVNMQDRMLIARQKNPQTGIGSVYHHIAFV